MSSGSRECIASTVFTPVAFPGPIPVKQAYMRNCSGTGGAQRPDSVALGHFRVILNQDVDPLNTSITPRAATAAGAVRDVTVVIVRNTPTPGKTTIEIYLRDNAGVDVDTADFVEVTLAQLPLL